MTPDTTKERIAQVQALLALKSGIGEPSDHLAMSEAADLITRLTEERDGLGKQVYDLTGIVADKNDKIAALSNTGNGGEG